MCSSDLQEEGCCRAGDVGMAEADKLRREGVDVATRTKAGAVAGVVAGASIAIPVAVPGSIAKTTAAVVAGGPGGFIAQNAAERAILDNAGYDKIASTYDLLDPVGLALSTLVPAGFGAVAVRGARVRAAAQAKAPLTDIPAPDRLKLRYDDARLDDYAVQAAQREGIPPEALLAIKNAGERSGSTATSPAGARGVMQFMPDTWKAYGKGDITDPVASIDAGARFMRDLIRQYDGDVRAAIAHYNGGGRAGKAVREGRAPPAAETQGYLARTDEYMRGRATETAARRAVAADPDTVAAARVRQTLNAIESYKLTPDGDLAGATAHADAMETAHAQMAAGEPVSVTDLLNLDDVRTGRLLDDMIATGEEARAALLPEAGKLADAGQVRQLRAELDQLRASRPDDSAAAVKARAKELQDGEGLSYKRATAAAEKEVRQALETHEAQLQRLTGLLDQNARAQRAADEIGRIDRELEGLRAQRGEVDAPASSPRQVALAVSDIFRPRQPAAPRLLEPARPAPAGRAEAARPTAPAAESRPAAARAPGQAGEGAVGSPDAAAAKALDSSAAAALEINPDLMVQLEGMDKPVRAADLLAQVKKEAADEVRDAPLLDVAANCFLRHV